MARIGAGFTTKKVGSRTVVVAAKKANKYGAKKRRVDGHVFDSIKESKRYGELKVMEKAGEIFGLQVHKVFDLFVRGVHVCDYECDFLYRKASDKGLTAGEIITVVEDVKSEATKTPLYELKKKLMLACHGIKVVEV